MKIDSTCDILIEQIYDIYFSFTRALICLAM